MYKVVLCSKIMCKFIYSIRLLDLSYIFHIDSTVNAERFHIDNIFWQYSTHLKYKSVSRGYSTQYVVVVEPLYL